MESKDLLAGKGGPDGSSSSSKAMEFKDLLVGKGGPMVGNPKYQRNLKNGPICKQSVQENHQNN